MQKYEKAGCWAGGKLVLFRFVGSVVDVVNWFGYELYIGIIKESLCLSILEYRDSLIIPKGRGL